MPVIALALSSLLTLTGSPSAQAPASEAPAAAAPLAVAQSGGGRKKPKVIRLEELKVEGRIQKPQAFYLLQRSNLNFEELNRAESFLPKVNKSVEKAPF
jgi:hypothetical protein